MAADPVEQQQQQQQQEEQQQQQREEEQEQEQDDELQDDEEEEGLSLSFPSVDVDADNNNNNNNDGINMNVNVGSNKAPRLPRWTRQEILVLIQGKKVAESRVRRGRTAALTCSLEPKWATVSSYCKRHGVNRGPVQCRKRWSNLAGDFKKIKEWESRLQDKDDSDSFWLMRNDVRRERKLPGFFDREVFDILNGTSSLPHPDDEEQPKQPIIFDSGRPAPPDDALFTDSAANHHDMAPDDPRPSFSSLPIAMAIPITSSTPTPLSEKQYKPVPENAAAPGTNEKQQPTSNPEIGMTSQGPRKRRRMEGENEAEAVSFEHELIRVLERNGSILNAQLEAHNNNMKLDREQRSDHSSSLVSVLNKFADAFARIADKL